MSLQQILDHIQKAQEELSALVKEEEQVRTGKLEYYTFVYLQKFDTGEWGPNYQTLQAYDIEQAFKTLGYIVKLYNLTIRDIRYGLQQEMLDEKKMFRSYWDEQLEKKRQT